ncbi:hypothetical protein Q0F99_13685 [Rathayibacter oskolensis]|uniref:arsenate reductase/protein-tyrosine-phosphatase family protein n=1 Tax=Rathayibacter oskolensis TaxID=1891671 RepID=UPI00265F5DF3|nr:hypothetical protein [Rathayibacter oskolensis]WKK70809.1 hypothetical protein Q0F99_13685 [Rathayibacter oskolensis]
MAVSDAPVFTVLSVCTGNICRSPLSEQLLRTALGDDLSPRGGALFAFRSAESRPVTATRWTRTRLGCPPSTG